MYIYVNLSQTYCLSVAYIYMYVYIYIYDIIVDHDRQDNFSTIFKQHLGMNKLLGF